MFPIVHVRRHPIFLPKRKGVAIVCRRDEAKQIRDHTCLSRTPTSMLRLPWWGLCSVFPLTYFYMFAMFYGRRR